MRSALVLIFAILVSAFLAGLLALSSRLGGDSTAESRIINARVDFVRSTSPETFMNLGDLGPRDRFRSIADPALLLPRSAHLPFGEISALYRYANGCDERDRVSAKDPEVRKAFRWHAFLCGRSPAPGEDFFRSAPLRHPSGAGYVALAARSGRDEFRSKEWLRSHARYSHLLERGDFPEDILLPSERIAAKLTPSAMRAIVDEGSVVVSDPLVLFLTEGREFTGRYLVYPLAKFREALVRAGAILATTDESSSCLLREGNACLNLDSERATREAKRPTLVLSAVTLLFALAAAGILFRNLRRGREEDRRKRFALSALAHELRTPVASLVLHTDFLRKDFDRLSADAQRSLLAVVDETQRLLRLTHATGQYLPAITGDRVILAPARIESLRSFVADLVAEAAPEATLAAGEDFAVLADPYWTAIAIRNLLGNARKHGRAPIAVDVRKRGDRAEIEVADAGTGAPATLEEMIQPLRKSRASSGMGLGLYIVYEVMREMDGRLKYSRAPTSFRLELPTGGDKR